MEINQSKKDILTLLIPLYLTVIPFHIYPLERYILSLLIALISFKILIREHSLFLKKEALAILARPPFVFFILIFLAAISGIFFSPDPVFSLKNCFSEFFVNILLYTGTSFYFLKKGNEIKFPEVIIPINLIFLGLYFGIMLQWIFFPDSPFMFGGDQQVKNPFGIFFLYGNLCELYNGIKHTSLFLTFLISVLFSALIYPDIKKRWPYLTLLLLNIFVLFSTTRRGAALAIMTGMCFSTLFIKARAKYLALALGAFLILLASLFIFGEKGYFVRENWNLLLKGKVEEAKMEGGSIPLRISTYREFIKEIAKNPFIPKGTGTKLIKIYHKDLIKRAGLYHGHNVFIDYAFQFGVQGALFLLLLIISQFRLFLRAYRISGTHREKVLFLAAMTFLIMFWTTNLFTDGMVHLSASLYWLFTGIASGKALKISTI